jgi:fibronectin type 3 domain-containing protein
LENRSDDEGSLRAGDTIRLTRGQLRLDFACGAIVTLKSPAALQVISPKRTRAILGTLKAHAGEGAEGFTVETPRTTVVDLGTDFGINVTRQGSTDVVVFNGAVDVHSDGVKGLNSRQRLEAGEAVRVSSEGTASRIVSIFDSQFSVASSATARLPQVPVISAVRDNIRRGESWHYYEIVHGGMREDAKAFVDRNHEWNGVDATGMPSYLLGGDYVKTFNDDKVNRAVEIEVTIERPAILFVLHDKRSPIPDWLREGFYDTGDVIGIDGAGFQRDKREATTSFGPGVSVDDTLSIWRKDIPKPGTVKLGAIPIGGERHNMYGIVAVPTAMRPGQNRLPAMAEQALRESKPIVPSPVGKRVAYGAIQQPNDVDVFSFQWTGGVAEVACQTSEYSTLDPVLTLLDSNEMTVGYAQTRRRGEKKAAIVANLPAGTCYAVVSAGDEIGEVGYYAVTVAPGTGEVSAPLPPSPSLVLSGKATAGGIALSWNELSDSQSYRIARSSDGVTYDTFSTTKSTSAIDTEVVPGTAYFYRLEAVKASGSEWSAPLRVRTRPTAVTHVQSYGLEPGLIVLEWRDVIGDSGYQVQRSIDGNEFLTIAEVERNSCGFRDGNVAAGTRYSYRVATKNDSGDSIVSPPITAISGIGAISAALRDDNSVAISWQADYPHERLAVERSTDCGQFTPIALLNRSQNSFVDKNVDSGNKYCYRVVAVNDGKQLDNVRSGDIDNIKLPVGVDHDYFALRYTGKIRIKKPGRYTFYLDSDDGSRLFIDGTMIIDNDGRHAPKKLPGSVDLTAGLHDLELHYFEYFGYNVLDLYWSPPGAKESRIPTGLLSSLKYQYYKGDWSYLPFNDTIAMSDVVMVQVPKSTVEPPKNAR